MRLLIVTQMVDTDDPVLGFFHNWIRELSKQFESIIVICLKKGVYDLPQNVRVYSLGKEEGKGRVTYIARFFRYIVKFRTQYDAVFVHMNQEYIILGGWLWKFLGKQIYMWRNHHAGSFLTDMAAAFCRKIFCTSRYSYTARYIKTVLMPVGIDVEMFRKKDDVGKIPRSILFLARMSPSKRPHILLEALHKLTQRGISYTAAFYGDPTRENYAYYHDMKNKAHAWAKNIIWFFEGIPNEQTPDVYNRYSICVNLSSSGMYDKTIFEAMACETTVLVTNKNLQGIIPHECFLETDSPDAVAEKLSHLLDATSEQAKMRGSILRDIVKRDHDIVSLAGNLSMHMS